MNVKKICMLLAASITISFSCLNIAYAEEESTVNSEANTGSEKKLSEDSMWEYTIQKDEESGEEYACIESYYGSDTEITIPEDIDGNTVKRLGNYAFYENERVTKFTISENLEYFGDFSFFGCTALKEFEVNDKNDIYEVKDGALLGDDSQLFVCFPAGKTETEYTIPEGVIALNPAAFATCYNLKKINFPETLETIGLYCFAECTLLNNITIPDNVQELGDFSFCGCTSLTDINLPDTMHTIGNAAFFKCTSLNKIEFPEYLQEIGQCAFVSTGFTEIEIPYTVQKIGYSAFGFTTDQSDQLVAMNSFTIKGLSGSVAQTYCAEEGNENISFVATYEEATQDSESTEEKKEGGLKPGIIAGIVIGCGAAVIIAVLIIMSARSKKTDDEDDEYDESGNVPDEVEKESTDDSEDE